MSKKGLDHCIAIVYAVCLEVPNKVLKSDQEKFRYSIAFKRGSQQREETEKVPFKIEKEDTNKIQY